MVALTNQQSFEQLLFRDKENRYCARFAEYQLHSVFEPQMTREGELFGYEALLRVYDAKGCYLRPDLFFHSLDVDSKIDVDRLARVIHLRNFAQARVSVCLSLNLMPLTLLHEHGYQSNFDLMVQRCHEIGLSSERIILEVLEHEIDKKPDDLAESLRTARQAGFQVAIDDFGALASNQQRVRALQPDLIKIDRSQLLNYMDGDNGRLVNWLEEGSKLGSRILMEGVETVEQHSAMLALGVELYQGYFLGYARELPVKKLVY